VSDVVYHFRESFRRKAEAFRMLDILSQLRGHLWGVAREQSMTPGSWTALAGFEDDSDIADAYPGEVQCYSYSHCHAAPADSVPFVRPGQVWRFQHGYRARVVMVQRDMYGAAFVSFTNAGVPVVNAVWELVGDFLRGEVRQEGFHPLIKQVVARTRERPNRKAEYGVLADLLEETGDQRAPSFRGEWEVLNRPGADQYTAFANLQRLAAELHARICWEE
jgi:hypothetical protein